MIKYGHRQLEVLNGRFYSPTANSLQITAPISTSPPSSRLSGLELDSSRFPDMRALRKVSRVRFMSSFGFLKFKHLFVSGLISWPSCCVRSCVGEIVVTSLVIKTEAITSLNSRDKLLKNFVLFFSLICDQLDAGAPEKISLVSRDEKSVLVVTYSDLKRCFDSTFQELQASASGSL